MFQKLFPSNTAQKFAGWLGVIVMILCYAALYGMNYWMPLDKINYTSRIWNWSQIALTIVACLVILSHWRSLTIRPVITGSVLAVLSALSHWQHDPSLNWCLQEGLAILVCFVAGSILFKAHETVSIPAFEPPLVNFGKSIGLGVLFAVPLAVVNNLYFSLTAGPIRFQNVFSSAFEALSPAIHEEIIFRFFIFAIVFNLLQAIGSPRWTMVIAIFMAVVPHSLNHLPELFLNNPIMGFAMLVATSLLFGLPMALLQIKRNLETAISFHWFIDFARFLFGF